MAKHLPFLALVAILGPPALGDVVHLKNGGRIEGQVALTEDGIVVRLPVGEMRLSKDAVDRIEKKDTAMDEYARRSAAVKPDDAEAHYQLGLWALGAGLKPQATAEFERTLAIQPDHEGARNALGYRKVGGVWLTFEQEMRANGFVQRDGQWMSPEAAAKYDALLAEAAKGARQPVPPAVAYPPTAPDYGQYPYYPYYPSYPYYSPSFYYPTVPFFINRPFFHGPFFHHHGGLFIHHGPFMAFHGRR